MKLFDLAAPAARAVRTSVSFVVLSLATLWLFPSAASGQVRLPGSVSARALSSAAVVGRVAAGELIRLAISLPLRNQAELDELLRHITNPRDPQYGQYLTPEQFAAHFGPTQADYDAVAQYARSQGLTIVGTHSNRTVLDVAGDAATVSRAFSVNLLQFRAADGSVFHAPDQAPAVPAAIAARVSGIVGLDNAVTLKPHLIRRGPIVPEGSPLPKNTGYGGYYGAPDIKTAYALNTTSRTGAGQTLALFELAGYNPADIVQYEIEFGLPNVPLENVLIDGAIGTPGGYGDDEVTLDIELQIALAPGVDKIIVYEAPNSITGLIDLYNKIATDNRAKQISTSWGMPENGNPNVMAVVRPAEDAAFKQMAAQGQSIYAASGDSGAYDDGESLSVDDPASQPYMVGVGGTSLNTNAVGQWQSESSWNTYLFSQMWGGGGGGVSAVWPIPDYQANAVSSWSGASSTMRNVPDVSLDADPDTGYWIAYQGYWWVYGGTSCASPLWAAFTALVNEQRAAGGKPPLGFANPMLYVIGNSSSYLRDFHDVADGSTNLYYQAMPGYDLATGWGSFIGVDLLNDLAEAARTTQIVAQNAAGAVGQTVNLTGVLTTTTDGIGVSGEQLTFLVDGVVVGTATTDVTGTATVAYTIPPGSGAGTRSLTITHAATLYYSPSSGSATLSVTKGNVGFSLRSSSGAQGSVVNLMTVMLSSGQPVLGRTVQFAVDDTAVGTAVSDASGATLAYAIPATMAIGVHNVTVTFAGDSAYNGASRTAAALTVTAPKVNVLFSLRPASGTQGQTVTLTTLVYSGGAPLSGKVIRFSVDGTVVGSAISDATGAAVPYTIPAMMTPGLHNVTVYFAGDDAYNTATRTSAALTVTSARLNVQFSLRAASGSVGQTVTLRTLIYSGGAPLAGKVIQFAVDGVPVGFATSDSSGAAIAYTIPGGMLLGLHNVTVSFAGDTSYNPATRTAAALTVDYPEPHVLSAVVAACTRRTARVAHSTVTFCLTCRR